MKRAFIKMTLLILSTWILTQTAAASEIKSEYIELGGVRTHYIDQGQGPVLLLIHGLGADLTRWQANIDVLTQTHRVVALDLVGFGQSEKPSMNHRAQVFVDQIHALMNALKIDNATLIGNSMGGWVSLLFAEQHPSRTDGLILVAPAFVFGLPNGLSADALAAGANPDTLEAMKAYLGRIYHNPDLSDATVSAALAKKKAIGDTATIQSVAASLSDGTDVLTRERLQDINTRTLIIHGVSDGVVPLSASQSIADLLPNAELTVQPEAGHWPQLERAEQFNQHVLSWLDSEASVKARIAEWISLWNPGTAPINADRFAAYEHVFAEGDNYLAVDDFTGEVLTLRGYQTYAQTWAPIMAAFERWNIVQVGEIEVQLNGNTAITYFKFKGDGLLKDGNIVSAYTYSTLVWQQQSGHWRLIHEHLTGGSF